MVAKVDDPNREWYVVFELCHAVRGHGLRLVLSSQCDRFVTNPEWTQVTDTGLMRPARSVIRFDSRIGTTSSGNSLCGANSAGPAAGSGYGCDGIWFGRNWKPCRLESRSENTRKVPIMGTGVPTIKVTACHCGSIFRTNRSINDVPRRHPQGRSSTTPKWTRAVRS